MKSFYHYFLAFIGNILYGFPSRKIFVLGITGTKGKSTTVELINAILEAAGKKTALLSSIRSKIDQESEKNQTSMTMPGRFALQRFLRRSVNTGCEYAIIEVTSQGVLQYRHRFIDWDGALFLNLHPEHIEAHGSFENYRDAKARFFKDVARFSKKPRKFFYINEADQNQNYFSNAASDTGKIACFSREKFIENELNGGKEFIGDWLSSDFNLENAAAATSFALSRGIAWPVIKNALTNFKGVPGRMEYVQREPFAVVVDYAHTPDSLEKIYQALTSENPNSKIQITNEFQIPKSKSDLICVLGAAGGGRDKWKRPEMGKIAARYCKEIILTNEDPYDEPPETILDQIAVGGSQILPPAIQNNYGRRDPASGGTNS